MVRFKNTARPEEAKSIMAAPDPSEGVSAPIFRGAVELCFWFAQDKFDRFRGPARLENEGAFRAAVHGGVAKQFEEGLLQKVRINFKGFFA